MRRFSNALRRLSIIGSDSSSSVTADTLCKSCHGLILEPRLLREFPESPLPGGSFALDLRQGYLELPLKRKDTNPGFPSLNGSAERGCSFCKLLLEAIEHHQQRNLSPGKKPIPHGDIHFTFRYHCAPEPGSQSFNLGEWPFMLHALEAVVSSSGDPTTLAFRLHCGEGSLVGRYLRIHGRSIDKATLSSKNISMMKEWMQECEQNHVICKRVVIQNRSSRPTRLLYVGDVDRGMQPCLVVTELMEFPEKYAALSYCWGPPSSLRMTTTHRTLFARMNGLSWEEIPVTFRDAFLVCKCLGIEYVWIDSLCIMQGDEEEWDHEAAIMGDIYRQAYVTIVAASSKSTNDGFLRRYSPARPVSLPFRCHSHPEISGEYFVSFTGFDGYLAEFASDVEGSTWNERGWTFQERLLSRRIIFFGEHQIYFECRTHRHSEDYGSPLKLKLPWHKYLQQERRLVYLETQWRWLVEQFSRRSFTFEKDRLPALAGLVFDTMLAAGSSPVFDQPLQYLSGHWNYELWSDLLWMPEDVAHQGPTDRELLSRIPSWSWCSRGGAVSFVDSRVYGKHCDISPRSIGSFRPSNYGITNNVLEINGLLSRRVLVQDNILLDFEALRRHDTEPLYISFDFHLPLVDFRTALDPPDVWLAPLCYLSRDGNGGYLTWGFDVDNGRYDWLTTQHVILLGLVLSPNLRARGCEWETEFQVGNLEARTAAETNCFRRIGLFEEHLPVLYADRERYLRWEFKHRTYQVW